MRVQLLGDLEQQDGGQRPAGIDVGANAQLVDAVGQPKDVVAQCGRTLCTHTQAYALAVMWIKYRHAPISPQGTDIYSDCIISTCTASTNTSHDAVRHPTITGLLNTA